MDNQAKFMAVLGLEKLKTVANDDVKFAAETLQLQYINELSIDGIIFPPDRYTIIF